MKNTERLTKFWEIDPYAIELRGKITDYQIDKMKEYMLKKIEESDEDIVKMHFILEYYKINEGA